MGAEECVRVKGCISDRGERRVNGLVARVRVWVKGELKSLCRGRDVLEGRGSGRGSVCVKGEVESVQRRRHVEGVAAGGGLCVGGGEGSVIPSLRASYPTDLGDGGVRVTGEGYGVCFTWDLRRGEGG